MVLRVSQEKQPSYIPVLISILCIRFVMQHLFKRKHEGLYVMLQYYGIQFLLFTCIDSVRLNFMTNRQYSIYS